MSSFRPWRSKAERGQAGTLSLGDISLQIQTERYIQPEIDDPATDLDRQKTLGGLTDDSSLATIHPVVDSDRGDDMTRGYKDNKIRFDLTEGIATRHDLCPTSPPGSNVAVGAPESFFPHLEHQEPLSPPALSPPRPRAQPQEQEQPEEAQFGRHPYSYA
jgi:hypothetical protein